MLCYFVISLSSETHCYMPTDRDPTYWTFLVVVIICFYYSQFTNEIVKLFSFLRSCYENMPLLMDACVSINTIGETSLTKVQRSQSEKSMNYSREKKSSEWSHDQLAYARLDVGFQRCYICTCIYRKGPTIKDRSIIGI